MKWLSTVFSKKCKYVVKERNMKGCFDSDYELIASPDESDKSDYSNEEIFVWDALLLRQKTSLKITCKY